MDLAKMLLCSGTFYNEVPCIYNEFSSTRPKLLTIMGINPALGHAILGNFSTDQIVIELT